MQSILEYRRLGRQLDEEWKQNEEEYQRGEEVSPASELTSTHTSPVDVESGQEGEKRDGEEKDDNCLVR